MNEMERKVYAADQSTVGDARKASWTLKQLDVIREHFVADRNDQSSRALAEAHVSAFVRGISKEDELAKAVAVDLEAAEKSRAAQTLSQERVGGPEKEISTSARPEQTELYRRIEADQDDSVEEEKRKRHAVVLPSDQERLIATASTATLVGAALESRGRDAAMRAAMEAELKQRYAERAIGNRSTNEFLVQPSETVRSQGRALLSDLNGRVREPESSR